MIETDHPLEDTTNGPCIIRVRDTRSYSPVTALYRAKGEDGNSVHVDVWTVNGWQAFGIVSEPGQVDPGQAAVAVHRALHVSDAHSDRKDY